jgi:hypothetical protein
MKANMSPRDKYQNDPEYRQLVDLLESFIDRAHYSPSEMREAVVLACINYEMRNVSRMRMELRPEQAEALRILDDFAHKRQRR